MEADVFCKFIDGDIPTEFVYRDDDVAVFADINPKAPVHLLIVPVRHYTGIADFSETDGKLLGHMLRIAHTIADERGLHEGYRLIINEGAHGNKIVPHLHIHLLGGKNLGPKIVAE